MIHNVDLIRRSSYTLSKKSVIYIILKFGVYYAVKSN